MGPVEYMVIEFPGTQLSPETIDNLRTPSGIGQIRIIDSLVVTKGTDNAVSYSELPGSPEVQLISDEDAAETAQVLPAGTTGLILLIEHLWAKGAADTVRAAGGRIATSIRIPDNHVQEALAQ